LKEIVINSTSLLSALTGVGRYTYEIAKRISSEDIGAEIKYYYGYNSKKLVSHEGENSGETKSLIKTLLKNKLIKKTAREMLRITPMFRLKSFDLYWEPNNILNTGIRTKRTLYTLHDLSVIRFPQWHKKESVQHFNKYIRESVNRADKIITDSAFIRDEIIGEYGLAPEKVRNIPLGFDLSIFHSSPYEGESGKIKSKYTDGREFILFVGSVEPRKNLLNLLKAYNSLPDNVKSEYLLLLAGFSGWENEDIMELINKNKKYVRYAGYVEYPELGAMYRSASLFAYPSFYEGFGLPPLEAMACSCPVLVSDRASLPEVCGDASVYVDPEDYEAIADGMVKVLSDSALSDKMRGDSLAQADKFSWDKAASEHAECMRELI